MNYLSMDFIMKEHSKIIKLTGGSDGVRDMGVLDSAVNAPFATFCGQDLYTDNIEKIAKVAHSIVKNHPFIDGNKRTGVHIMLLLLHINNYPMWFSVQDIITFGLCLAGSSMSYKQLVEILHRKSMQ